MGDLIFHTGSRSSLKQEKLPNLRSAASSSVRLPTAAFAHIFHFRPINISSESVDLSGENVSDLSSAERREGQMEKLNVGLCRNSQRSWQRSDQQFASCSLIKNNSGDLLKHPKYTLQLTKNEDEYVKRLRELLYCL